MVDRTNSMRKLTVSIPDALDEKLRKYVDEKFVGIKGGLSKVTKDALELYFKKVEDEQ